METISGAKNLTTLRLQTQLMGGFEKGPKFTSEDARDMMLRDENSKLRVIAIGSMQYKVNPAISLWFNSSLNSFFFSFFFFLRKGKWVLEEVDERVALKFVVSANVAEDKWQT